MRLKDLLAPLDEIFRREQIKYAVIGGYAVAVWGEVRATRDIDLLCSAPDIGLLVGALAKANMRFERRTGDFDDALSIIRMQAGRLDLALLRNLCPPNLKSALDLLLRS